MPLVVKPNLRRMRYMRDSPAEGSPRAAGSLQRLRWGRIAAVLVVAAILVVVLLLAVHH